MRKNKSCLPFNTQGISKTSIYAEKYHDTQIKILKLETGIFNTESIDQFSFIEVYAKTKVPADTATTSDRYRKSYKLKF